MRAGPVAVRPEESSDLAVDRQSILAGALRPRAGRHAQRLRPDGQRAVSSGIARLAGMDSSPRGRRLDQEARSLDRHLGGLPPGIASRLGQFGDRRRQPPPLADELTRLDAESIRDAVLSASGRLDWTIGGPSTLPFCAAGPGVHWPRPRSITRSTIGTPPAPVVGTSIVSCSDHSRSVRWIAFGRVLIPRSSTPASATASITPLQALAMLTDPFVIRQSFEHFARRNNGRSPTTLRTHSSPRSSPWPLAAIPSRTRPASGPTMPNGGPDGELLPDAPQ